MERGRLKISFWDGFLFSGFNEFGLNFSEYFPYEAFFQERKKRIKCFYALILARLCAKAINPVSISTFLLPRSMCLLKPLLFFIIPKVASTSAHRCFQRFTPTSPNSFSRATCLCLSRLWLISITRPPVALWQPQRKGQPLQFCAL